ncbi:sigma-54-dependent Fis family transcriptional regulator [Brevibacillus fluminis]|uniref:Sigma-54-dependent Fis family transcriptional regulator n=1 Tax=Brevibacillus fluminis TaxID=511487 RepID=A0A3M8DBP8_9BACL|nr:sigma-54 dependent transcriptional regulator [Brevibacillus fluminis]RNB85462.1 sigma-54-dependent Fis family transcriptional regulator [Brevibacillus fluminis]
MKVSEAWDNPFYRYDHGQFHVKIKLSWLFSPTTLHLFRVRILDLFHYNIFACMERYDNEGGFWTMSMSLYNRISNNQKSMRQSWEKFICEGIIEDRVPPFLAQSWSIDKQLHIDPYLPKLPLVNDESYLHNNKPLLTAVEDTLKEFSFYLESSSSAIHFNNPEGVLAIQYGDLNAIEKLRKFNNVTGGKLDQQSCGTTAVSLALKNKRPFFTSGADHFVHIFHDCGCFAIPLLNKRNNELLGVLDISGPEHIFNDYVFALTHSTALAIEKRLEQYYMEKDALLLDYYINRCSHDRSSLLAINTDKQIFRCSERASSLLGGQPANWIGHSASALSIPKLREYMRVCEEEIEFYDILPNEVAARIVLQRILHQGEFIGWIVQLFSLTQRADKVTAGKCFPFEEIIGSSPAIQHVIQKAKKICGSQANILILGESGTGKELFARAIHFNSDRKNGPFISVNCGAIPKELIASELFGHEEGAFSGAKKGGEKGKFELANKGTIFLDEIGELPLEQQVYLLRVLQEREFYRLGGKQLIPLDVRIIAATNVDLEKAVRNKHFREDLYFRLNVINLRLPTLSERGQGDVVRLVNHFFSFYCRQERKNVTLTNEALEFLGTYTWRGNVREVENTVHRIVVLADNKQITVHDVHDALDHFEQQVAGNNENTTDNMEIKPLTMDEVERMEVVRTLIRNNGNISKSSKELNISRPTLYRKIDKYQIMKDKIIQ